jgi:hypothetical protein
MGRPIKDTFFGNGAVVSGEQIVANAWVSGDTVGRTAYVVKQTGSKTFRVTTSAGTSKCRLVTDSGGPQAEGQMTITATKSDASTFNIAKISSRIVTDSSGNRYQWAANASSASGDIVGLSTN